MKLWFNKLFNPNKIYCNQKYIICFYWNMRSNKLFVLFVMEQCNQLIWFMVIRYLECLCNMIHKMCYNISLLPKNTHTYIYFIQIVINCIFDLKFKKLSNIWIDDVTMVRFTLLMSIVHNVSYIYNYIHAFNEILSNVHFYIL